MIQKSLCLFAVIIFCCCNSIKLDDPDISGVWRKVSEINKIDSNHLDTTDFPSSGWEFVCITKTAFIQKYYSNCYYKVREWNISQEGKVVSITSKGTQCQIEYAVTISNDTMLFENADIISKWVHYDTIANQRWNLSAINDDMNKIAGVFCKMTQRNKTYWINPMNDQQLFNFDLQIEEFAGDTIEFLANKKSICDTPALIAFVPVIPNNVPVDFFYWQFGDGQTSAEMYPTHFYKSFGPFTVQLFAKFGDGRTMAIRREGYIQ
jgi:hypothetical protein